MRTHPNVEWSLALLLAAAVRAADMPAAPGDAPPNTWVKVSAEATGWRNWPLLVFDPALGTFVISGGEAGKKPHADTERFDPAAAAWRNAYPAGAPYQAVSGPTDAAFVEIRETEPGLKVDKHGVMRILRAVNPYCRDPGLFNQYAFCPDDGLVYSYFQDGTLTLDPRTSVWADLKVPRFSRGRPGTCLLYGALAYDPVNQELLSIGGTSDEDAGSPGTWIFRPAAREWKKSEAGSPELRALQADARAAQAGLAALVNAARNRFYVAESDAEATRDLAAFAGDVCKQLEACAGKLAAARLSGSAAGAVHAAAADLSRLQDDARKLASGLSGKITNDLLVHAQTLVETAERVVRDLDVEPCGRAASPAVTCAGLGKIVLFGGCRMDGYLADTWVYDCQSRTWEQRRPKVAPAPRAGHVLAWLPKSRKVVLAGAIPFFSPYGVPHGNRPPPRDLWVYDVEADQWKRLAAEAPDAPLDAYGAADTNDMLLVVGRDPKNKYGRITYRLKVDPGAPDADSAGAGVPAGTAQIVFDTPADFDRTNAPDAAAVARLLAELPPNQWTLLPKPRRTPNSHGWGNAPYDTVRHQFISFGGGHSAWHYNDVAHYSLRTATWSCGFGEEYAYFNASFAGFFNQSFRNRPMVPTHVWDCGAFDEASGKVVYCVRGGTWIYDPATRAWEYPPVWQNGGGSKVSMRGTPHGVVYLDSQGTLQRYDLRTRSWTRMPVTGGTLPAGYGDTVGIAYDSKRDALWISDGGSPMCRYDMKSGAVTVDSSGGKPVNIYMRHAAYIPELDMVLSAGRVSGPDGAPGNLAYDVAAAKWVTLALPCSDGKPRVNDQSYSDINLAVAYDPGLKRLVFHSNEAEILVARIEPASLKVFPARIQAPKRK
jgi:hypothetical protein